MSGKKRSIFGDDSDAASSSSSSGSDAEAPLVSHIGYCLGYCNTHRAWWWWILLAS